MLRTLLAEDIVGLLLETTVVPTVSRVARTFRRELEDAPPDIQEICSDKYVRWRENPARVNFEPKHSGWFAVEITRKWHALCKVEGPLTGATVTWYRLLNYNTYSAFLSAMRRGGPR